MQQQQQINWLDSSNLDCCVFDHEEDQSHPLAPSFSQDDWDNRLQPLLLSPLSMDNDQDSYTLPPMPVDSYLPATPLNQQEVPLPFSLEEHIPMVNQVDTDLKNKLDEQDGGVEAFYSFDQHGFQNLNEEAGEYPNGLHRIESCTSNVLSDDTDTSFNQQMSVEENQLVDDESDFEDCSLSSVPESCSPFLRYDNNIDSENLFHEKNEPFSSNRLASVFETQFTQMAAKRMQRNPSPCDRPTKRRCLSLEGRQTRNFKKMDLMNRNVTESDQASVPTHSQYFEGFEETGISLSNHFNINSDIIDQPPQNPAPSTSSHPLNRIRHISLPDDFLNTRSDNLFGFSAPSLANTMTSSVLDINGNISEPQSNLFDGNSGISGQSPNDVKTETVEEYTLKESLASDRFQCKKAAFDINFAKYLDFPEDCPSTANPVIIPSLSTESDSTNEFLHLTSLPAPFANGSVGENNNPNEESSGEFFMKSSSTVEMQPDITQAETTHQTANYLQQNGTIFSPNPNGYPNTNIEHSTTSDAFVPNSSYGGLDELSPTLDGSTTDATAGVSSYKLVYLINAGNNTNPSTSSTNVHTNLDLGYNNDPSQQAQGNFDSQKSKLVEQDCMSSNSQSHAASGSLDIPKNVDPGVKEAYLKGVETGEIMPILKQELKMAILSRRSKEGKEDLNIAFVPPPKTELTEEEEKKKKHRQNLNKIAAAKHRQSKKNQQIQMEEEYVSLEEKNRKLKEHIQEMEAEIEMKKNQLFPPGFAVFVTQ